MRADPRGLARLDILLPIRFLDLMYWAVLRDFGQSVSNDFEFGFKETLLSLAKFLVKVLQSTLSGARSRPQVPDDSPKKLKLTFMSREPRGRLNVSLLEVKNFQMQPSYSPTGGTPLRPGLCSWLSG